VCNGRYGAVGFNRHHLAAGELEEKTAFPVKLRIGLAVAVEMDLPA
jgi:hypothetical protein